MNSLPDLVFRVGRPCEELRYAIRSLTELVPHRQVWTAGIRTPWLTCQHIDVPREVGQGRYAHAYAVLRAILADDRLTPTVILADDDMFALAPVTTLSYSRGPLGDVDPGSRRRGHRDTRIATDVSTPCRDLHVPSLVDRARLAAQLDALDLPDERKAEIWWRTLHGGTEPTYHPDAKLRSKADPIPPGATWVSTDGESWRGVAGAYLRGRFSTPSRYEKGAPDG